MDELYHRLAKGTGWKNHKYISRYWKNGRWNYVYSNTEAPDPKKSNSSEHYTFDKHKVVLPKKWASNTNEWNGKFVKDLNKSVETRDINKAYAEKFSNKYNPYSVTRYKDPSWLVKAKDRLGYDEGYNYRKATDFKKAHDDHAQRSRKKADTAYETYKSLPNDHSYESYQLAENIAQATKVDAEYAGKLYVKAQEEYFKTPLGKVEKARDDVRTWVDGTIDSITKKIKKRKK